jgi:DNA-binding transcriptional MerR regulator
MPMRIGELAARSGRTIHTIRWYEAQRLMPGVTRAAGGQRVYGEQHVGWLELLQRLRRTGMSIREMREFATLVKQGDATIQARAEFLELHRKQVDAEIVELTDSLRLIDRKIKFYRDKMAAGRGPKERQKGAGA